MILLFKWYLWVRQMVSFILMLWYPTCLDIIQAVSKLEILHFEMLFCSPPALSLGLCGYLNIMWLFDSDMYCWSSPHQSIAQ